MTPSLSSAASAAPPAYPLSGSIAAIDVAFSSVRLTASPVEMSGFGAPFLTATPRRSVAITVALFGMTLPVRNASGNGENSSETSSAWPLACQLGRVGQVRRVKTYLPYPPYQPHPPYQKSNCTLNLKNLAIRISVGLSQSV